MNIMGRSSGQWLIGLIILAIGILFLVENIFGIEMWERVWLFWPIIFMLWGLMEIFQKKSLFFGLILMAIGIIFLLRNMELYQWSDSICKFWPIIIIALGFDQLIKKPEPYKVKSFQNEGKEKKRIITQDDEII